MVTLLLTLMAQAPDAGLLEKLAAHDARREAYLDAHAVTQQVRGVELDGDDTPRHTTVSTLVVKRVGGKLSTTVVKAVRDEADDLVEAKARAKKRDDENKRTESPFAARNQANYAFTPLGPDPTNPSLLRLGIAPRGKPAPEIFVGEAVVDPHTGELVRQSLKLSKYPLLVDRLEMRFEYATTVAGTRMLTTFFMRGAGGLPLLKKRGDITVTFEYPPEP
ncbi:MAG: hypothetical protein JNG84_11820 [Archangium sp.]|nr:hypothetical protein [Archangium sp.]